MARFVVFIWRGIGILVPIVFFLTAFIVSRFVDKPYTFSNQPLILWTTLVSGIVLLIIGILSEVTRAGTPPEERKGRAHFMFIPIVFWGILLTGFGTYRAFAGGKKGSGKKSEIDLTPVEADLDTRIVHFYNDYSDSLKFIVADTDGLVDRKTVAPGQEEVLELPATSYLFASYTMGNEPMLRMPKDTIVASNDNWYTMITDEEGSYFQRILNPGTSNQSDYDEAWLMLSGQGRYTIVDVTELAKKPTQKTINRMSWVSAIRGSYDGYDLIEPLYLLNPSGSEYTLLMPGDKLPNKKELGKKERVFAWMKSPENGQLNVTVMQQLAADMLP